MLRALPALTFLILSLPPAHRAGDEGEGRVGPASAASAATGEAAGWRGVQSAAAEETRADTTPRSRHPAPPAPATAVIPGRSFVPPYAPASRSAPAAGLDAASLRPAGGYGTVEVATFELDAVPVTEAEFLGFVEAAPSWRKGRAPAILVGDGYLSHWPGPLQPAARGEGLERPVTRVSWFAARAYCAWRDARLPTTDEWELAARASRDRADAFRDRDFNRETLRLLQSRPAPHELPPVGRTFRNVYGVWDLHGLVHEWTEDFNNLVLTGAGRDDQGLDRRLFCAAGSVDATDRSDYAAFLRYAFRTDLQGSDTGPLLGFRCARTP